MHTPRYALLLLMLLFRWLPGHAQTTYPIQVNVHLLPPYSPYLSDYYSTTRERIAVTLINRDQLKPTVNVKLRMIISAPGSVRIQTNDNAFFQPVAVDNGMPVRLTQDDLAPYFQPNALITQGNLPSGRLPEGMVEFCFQAVEAYTGQILSASTCARAWIISQKPPLLSLPRNQESVAFREPLNLLFQWTPQHQGLSQVEYDFILKELWDNGMAPQAAFVYAPEIYRETTRATSFAYGAMQPQLLPGKRYAWCVRAKVREGMDELNLFQNEGYSEVRWFTLQDNCMPPQYVEATAERRRLNLKWNALPEHTSFTIAYRPRSQDGVTQQEWKEVQTFEPQTTLYDLEAGKIYEYRVGSLCQGGTPVYTPILTATIPAVDNARLAQCGILPEVNVANQEPLKALQTAEVFYAGDFPITVVTVSGSNGTFTGQGWTEIPWLNDVKVAVEFKNISINTDHRMINGFVEAKYDKQEGQVANLDDVFEGGFDQGLVKTGLTGIDYTLDFSIPGVEAFALNDAGDLIITDAEGTPHSLPITDKEGEGNEGNKVQVFPMTVKDKDGTLYQVEKVTETDAQGNTHEVAKATKLGTAGSPLPPGSFDPDQINERKAIVTFNAGKGRYAFDTWQPYYNKIKLIGDKYKKMGADYYASWKLLPAGASDQLAATIDVKDNTIDPTKVIFTTPLGTRYNATYDNGTYTLTITAGPAGDVQELYALYPKPDGKYYTFGKVGIATYAPQQHEVVLVTVDNVSIDEDRIRQVLADTYGPLGITWTVRRDAFEYQASGLMAEATGLSTYNEAMRSLNQAYRAARPDFSKSANYLFFLKATGNTDINNRDLTGFMPRGAQFGYIFTSEVQDQYEAITVAHELGHGRWKLYHPFDKHYGGYDEARLTDNLLAYGNGQHIAKWQWDQIADPALIVSVFEGDEKSEYSDSQYFTKLIQQIRCAFISKQNDIPMPEKYVSGGYNQSVGLVYGLPSPASEINGLKLSRAWWTASKNTTVISGIQSPSINPAKGTIAFKNFTIRVPVEVYNNNNGITPFEHFRQYLLPTEKTVNDNFERIWKNGIATKISTGQPLDADDMSKLKSIASCETKFLTVDARYNLIVAIMDFSTREYYEDLILDILQTTPPGAEAKDLFTRINGNASLLGKLLRAMDNYGGDERNFDRLAKELYALFRKGYTEKELVAIYEKIPESRRLLYLGFGRVCNWSMSVSRDDNRLIFKETQIVSIKRRTYVPGQDGSSLPECDSETEEYEIGLQDMMAVGFASANFLVSDNQIAVLPASVYYILIKSYWNEEYYQMANAGWTGLGIATPIDEFYLLNKAFRLGVAAFRTLRIAKVRQLAKAKKIEVPLNQEGLKLKEQSLGRLDDFVEWGVNNTGGVGSKVRLGEDVAKGVVKHPNWVEVLDIRTKILARKPHVLEIEGLTKTRNYMGTTLEGFTGCHSEQALMDYVNAQGGSYRINGKPSNLLPDEVFEGQPIITKNGKDYVKTNGQPLVEYSPGKYGGTSTFFPANWDNARILDEVEHAIANNHGVALGNNPSEYFGFSRDGKVEIHFYLNTDGTIGSYFPKKK